MEEDQAGEIFEHGRKVNKQDEAVVSLQHPSPTKETMPSASYSSDTAREIRQQRLIVCRCRLVTHIIAPGWWWKLYMRIEVKTVGLCGGSVLEQ
jgi:hypothetical protein